MVFFDKFTDYSSAFDADNRLMSLYDIEDESIYETSMQFSYGKVKCASFAACYKFEGYHKRKIVAIPAALLAGALKSIYHLAQAALIGLPKLLSGESNQIKVYSYCFLRDLQEAFGWLVTLFDDVTGHSDKKDLIVF